MILLRSCLSLGAALAIAGSTQAAVVTTNLIGEYSFETGDATDSVGLIGNSSSVGTPTFVTDLDRTGTTVLSVSQGNYINIAANANVPEGAEARTYAIFFKTTVRGNDGSPFRSGSPGTTGGDFSVELNGTAPGMTLNRWFDDLSFNLVDADSVWQHVAVSHDGSTMRAYVNGSLAGSRTVAINTGNNGFRFGGPRIGRTDGGIGSFLIDDVLIYDRALTLGEIGQLAAANPIPEPSTFAMIGLAGMGLILRRRRH